jgi:hypothetical protein
MYKLFISFLMIILVAFGCVNTDFITDPSSEPEEGTLVIQSSGNSVLVNGTMQVTAVAYDATGTEVPGVQFNWSSSSASILSIDQSGIVTGNALGQAWVIVKADGYKKDSIIVTVVQDVNQLANIVVTPNFGGTINIGETIQFSAQGFNNMGDPINNLNFTWQSSNPNIVSINGSGLAMALASGDANITAVYNMIQSSNIPVTVKGNSKTGTFTKNPGTSYNVSGSVEVVDENGQLSVNFGSDFTTSNGPGLFVYISPTQNVGLGSIELGSIISTSGSQSYAVPAGNNLEEFSYVIIHCKPFNVTFGYANIQ